MHVSLHITVAQLLSATNANGIYSFSIVASIPAA